MGRPPRINRDGVVRAAIEVLDEEGTSGLSLDRIAAELGVSAPTLYYHYADKSAILDAVAAAMLSDLGVSPADGDWREVLVKYSEAFYHRVSQHPNVAVVLIQHLPERAVLQAFEMNAESLVRAGVPVEATAAILEGVQHFVWGMALYVAVGAVNPAFSGTVDPDRYPWWSEALAARSLVDVEFLRFGVSAVIDGILARVDPDRTPSSFSELPG